MLMMGASLMATSNAGADPVVPAGRNAENGSSAPWPPVLPEVLLTAAGKKVATSEEWKMIRRPELQTLVQREIYGFLPKARPVRVAVTQTKDDALGGKATLRELSIRFPDLPETAPEIRVALWIPRQVERKPIPVVLAINYCGNANVSTDPAVTMYHDRYFSHPKDEGQRGSQAANWSVEQIIDRGYAFATFHESDIKADKNAWDDGLFPFLKEESIPEESQPATIALWAWGFHRCVDALSQQPDLDAGRIAIFGHSRRGKAALCAGAMDERIAIVIPHQSGTGGLALSRQNQQETVDRITRVFPHWFCPKFRTWAGREDQMPVDQHSVAALVAPRLLLDTEGSQDAWANFPSSLETLRAANPAWTVQGVNGVLDGGLAAHATDPAAKGRVVQIRLDEKHEVNPRFWKEICDALDRHERVGP